MSITYNTGIPFSTHNPSVDQPNMLVNTNSIAQYVAVDHVPFNTSGSGQHEQVTFNSNNVPSTPTSPPVLFTNTVGSFPQLFFYSGTTFNQYQSTATSAGTYLLGGLILKCGKFTAVAGTSANLKYAASDNPLVDFPNTTIAVIPTVSNTSLTAGIMDGSLDASGFTVLKSNSAAATIFFIAIGY